MGLIYEIIYWSLYAIVLGGVTLALGAQLIHDTIILTRDAFGKKELDGEKEDVHDTAAEN